MSIFAKVDIIVNRETQVKTVLMERLLLFHDISVFRLLHRSLPCYIPVRNVSGWRFHHVC